MDSDKKVLDVVYQKRDTSKVQISNLLLHPPDKYLIDCYSLSRWQCCILIGWEERASPAGGHVQWGASYWGQQEAAQTERK